MNGHKPPTRRCTVPLIIAIATSNLILLLCLGALGLLAFLGDRRDQAASGDADPNCQAVRDYLAHRLPHNSYRIRQWMPAEPIKGTRTTLAGNHWDPLKGAGSVQRVKIDFYGPSHAKRLDVICLVQNGQVTRVMEAEHLRFPSESVRDWDRRQPLGITPAVGPRDAGGGRQRSLRSQST